MHLRDLDRYDEALESFEQAERLGVGIPQECAEVALRQRDERNLQKYLGRVKQQFGEEDGRALQATAGLLYLQEKYQEAKDLLAQVEKSPSFGNSNWKKFLFAMRANDTQRAINYHTKAFRSNEFQAFVFCQASPGLKELHPDFYSSPERHQMLRDVGLDAESIEKLDIPPLPSWA